MNMRWSINRYLFPVFSELTDVSRIWYIDCPDRTVKIIFQYAFYFFHPGFHIFFLLFWHYRHIIIIVFFPVNTIGHLEFFCQSFSQNIIYNKLIQTLRLFLPEYVFFLKKNQYKDITAAYIPLQALLFNLLENILLPWNLPKNNISPKRFQYPALSIIPVFLNLI